MIRRLSALVAGVLLCTIASSQSVPNGGSITSGQVWTVSQWINAWQSKFDVTGGSLTSPTITNPAISGGTQSAPAITSPTVSGGTFTSPAITGSATLNGSFALTGASALTIGGSNVPAVNSSPTWTGPNVFSGTTGFPVTINSNSGNALGIKGISGVSALIDLAGNGKTLGTNSLAVGQDSSGNSLILARGAQSLFLGANSGNQVSISSAGAVNIAPSTAVTSLTVNGSPSNYTQQVLGSSSSGLSYGLFVGAGSTASDEALNIVNAAQTSQFMVVFGNGGIIAGAPTGGNEGPGTINMQGCFVNGVSCAGGGGPAAAGTLTGTTLASNVVNTSITSVGTLASLNVSGSGLFSALTVTGNGVFGNLSQGGNPVYAGIPQNAQSGAYTLVLTDANKHIYVNSGGGTITVPANSSVAFPIGTAVTIVNDGSGSISVAITTDTMVLSPGGSTGTRTLAQFGEATLLKVTATRWFVSGPGLTRLIEPRRPRFFDTQESLAQAA